jgi:SAM-dependent methyltransferase
MIHSFNQFYLTQQFNPGFIGFFLNPFYHARRGLYQVIAKLSNEFQDCLLDVGCGTKPYRNLFSVNEYVGLEIDTPENRKKMLADFYYEGEIFPFPDQKFNGVICNQVLEHVFTPDGFLSEIRRVLKTGGKLLLTVPFVWDEHEQPWDYARYSSFGLKSLLERNGFNIIAQHKTNADVRVLFQLTNAYLYKILWTQRPILNLLICAVLMAPINILGSLVYRLLPDNPDLYLDQVVLAVKVMK